MDLIKDESCICYESDEFERSRLVLKFIHATYLSNLSFAESVFDGSIDLLSKYMFFNEDNNKEEIEDIAENSIQTIDISKLPLTKFRHEFESQNNIVVIEGLTKSWSASEKWVTIDGKPNVDYIG